MSKVNWEELLSEETAAKVKDLEALIDFNKEAMEAYRESVEVHTKGMNILKESSDESVAKIVEQFQSIIDNHNIAFENLHKYNQNAENFLSYLQVEKDQHTITVVLALLKLVAFK